MLSQLVLDNILSVLDRVESVGLGQHSVFRDRVESDGPGKYYVCP